jgi:hypothetical protein
MANQNVKNNVSRKEEVRNATAIVRCLSVRAILYSVITGAVAGRVRVIIIRILTISITAIIPCTACQYKPNQ